MVFPVSGRQLITMYLCSNARRGELSDAILPGDCSVTAGVDVFAVSPNELPFEYTHIRPHGEVWGYFSAAHMADSIQTAPGGCWAQYGEEKSYVYKSQTFGYRRRFAFHATRVEANGTVMWAPTRWMMKEYRLNKDAAMFRHKKLEHPEANMDFVIRKFFTKPEVPLRPPARSGDALQGVGVRARLPSSVAQPTKVPVKASAVAVRKDPTKTKTKTKTKKVVPPPLPPYARSEGGVALQQGGTGLPPLSARPPLPPKVVTKPVAPPNPAQVVAKPVAPSNHAQVIAKPVAPPPPPKVIEKPVSPLPQPQAIPTPVAPPPPPQVIARPVASLPPLARSSQNEAALSRAQPHNPNANMELVVYRPPVKPLTLAASLPPPPGLIAAAERTIKVPSARWVIGQYLGPKAVDDRQISKGVKPGFVAEGVDVFAVSPDALPSPPIYRTQNGQLAGYFFAAKPTARVLLVLGGCWTEYGREKKYSIRNGEVIAFHRRFVFQTTHLDGDDELAFEPTRWLMKEYRMNKDAPSASKVQKGPGANMDLVVLKLFTKPVLPPEAAAALACFSESGKLCSNYPLIEG